MATNPLSITLPQPAVPFLDQAGGVSKVWLYYFLTLLKRTGDTPGISAAALQKEIDTLFADISTLQVAIAEAEIPLSQPPPPLPIAIEYMWPEDPQKPQTDPIIAALLVSDL